MVTTGRRARVLIGALLLATLAAGASVVALAQASGVLRVTLTLGSGSGARPAIRRHALLVSDTPPSRAPWRVVIGQDGTGRVTLPAGAYIVESEEPLVVQGRAYEWRQTVEVTAGGETTLALTEANAEITAADTTAAASGAPARLDPWDLLLRWQDSVVVVWTPDRHASGIVVASTGVIATTQRVVGAETDVEVQLGPHLKVAARVVASDPSRDVALLQVAPDVVASRDPVPLACDAALRPALARGESVSAISTPLRRQPTTSVGRITRIETGPLAAIFDIPLDSAGGPVFAADGRVIGLASLAQGDSRADAVDVDVARVEAICDVMGAARNRLADATPPDATPRPVDPADAITEDVLKARMKERTGSLRPLQVASDGFEVALLTPVVAYAALQQTGDFGQWTQYVADRLPVLLLRVTPKQTESFWMKVARGAAMTQGVALPPITRFEPGFARMRVRCGDRELTPIHPFRIERRISETAAIREGLYVLAADVLTSACGDVTLEIFSEKAPQRGERVTIGATVIDQVRRDLASTAPAR